MQKIPEKIPTCVVVILSIPTANMLILATGQLPIVVEN
jgi:hypothetical protein